jgi:pilus assembly protein CpaB
MNSKRVVFLLLAVIVAGATAFMARSWLQNERAAILAQARAGASREVPVAAAALQVLVARSPIHTGQIVKPDDMRWQSWPQGSLAPTYIVEGKRPLSDFVGAVARGPIADGEPITEGKLVLAGTRGFMAAVLQPGTRAVSVPITATSAVSGFIYAGDRVDVLLTHVLNGRTSGQHTATETILRNARVIAMDQKIDFSPGDKPDVGKTATLELTPKQTELVTLAVKMGDLSLVLRALQEPNDDTRDPAVTENAPAEPGDSFIEDSQVSKLIRTPGPTPTAIHSSILVLRGSTRAKLELDGSGIAQSTSQEGDGPGNKPNENKTNKTVFTPMSESNNQ